MVFGDPFHPFSILFRIRVRHFFNTWRSKKSRIGDSSCEMVAWILLRQAPVEVRRARIEAVEAAEELPVALVQRRLWNCWKHPCLTCCFSLYFPCIDKAHMLESRWRKERNTYDREETHLGQESFAV